MNTENMDFLDVLNLKPVPRKLLMDIMKNGDSSVADISVRLNMPKSTIYDALSPLVAQSLVNEYSGARGKVFGMSDDGQLARVHGQKVEELKRAHSSLISFIQNNKAHTNDGVSPPKIKFYAGVLGIKQAFRDIPWTSKHKETYLLWPAKDMIDVDEEFFKWHGKQRFVHKVVINAIEKHSDRVFQKSRNHQWLINDFKENLVRVKYLPKGVDVKMSYWIYGDKCLFASGGDEKIAFTVQSQEFSQMMKLMWQNTWDNALK